MRNEEEPQQLATQNCLHRHKQATACLDRQLGGEGGGREGGGDSQGNRMGGISDEVWGGWTDGCKYMSCGMGSAEAEAEAK